MLRHFAASLLWIVASSLAGALDYRGVADAAVVLYDAPSTKGAKLFILGRDTPLEIIVNIEGWAKVRDASGTLGWVERKALADRKSVQIKSPFAEILSAPTATASVVFRAEQNVLLMVIEPPVQGWAKVRHRDGSTGYTRIENLFGL